MTALSAPTLLGDERDAILAKWNQLQAYWGTGKGYYSNSTPPVDFTLENPFCRFKVRRWWSAERPDRAGGCICGSAVTPANMGSC